MKVYDVDWAEIARLELRELGIEPPNRDAEFKRWKADPVLFIDECELCGGPIHPRQAEIVREIVDLTGDRPRIRDAVVLKTRQVGMSWLLMGIELWLMLFWGPVRILNASQRFEDVDDGGSKASTRSLHGRILEMYEVKIPSWLRFRSPLDFKEGMIQNSEAGFIHGASSTPNVGRSMTLDMAVLDEFAHSEWTRLVWASISQSCKHGKIANSTPNGRGNEYFNLVQNHKKRRLVKLDYHWTIHPVFSEGMHVSGSDPDCEDCVAGSHWASPGRMTSPWYEEQCAIIGDEALIAQELDMSFDRSTRGRVYPGADRATHFQEIIHNPAARQFTAWDFGYSGATVLIRAQVERYDTHNEIQVFAYHEDAGRVIDHYIPIVDAWVELYGECQHIGDPAGLAKGIVSGKGPIHALAENGIYVDAPNWLHSDAAEGIRLVNLALAGGKPNRDAKPVRLRINPLADRLMDCLENTHYPVDKNGDRLPGREMPADNEFTHATDALRYLVHYVIRTLLQTTTQATSDDVVHDTIMGGVLGMTF